MDAWRYCTYALPVNARWCQFVLKREEFPHVLLGKARRRARRRRKRALRADTVVGSILGR